MRIISVVGITESGKTTTIENIIRELKKRGYSVGSVKEIHFEDFHIDTEGSNTDRHKKAGSTLVTARGHYETDILYQEKLDMEKILGFYNHDFVILEGVSDMDCPKIITAHDIEGIEAKMDETVFAISGRISDEIDKYKGLPAINSITDVEELVDLIEEITSNKITMDSSKAENDLIFKINGEKIPLNPSQKYTIADAIANALKNLDIQVEDGDIDICIKR